jgi:site-specific recombinase XerD
MRIGTYIEGYKNKQGLANIKFSVLVDSIRVKLPSHIAIPPGLFDKENQCILQKHPDSKNLNLILNQKKALINDILVKYTLAKRKLSADIIKAEFENPSTDVDFISWMRKEIADRTGTLISESTAKQHNNLLNHLIRFKKRIGFADINRLFVDDFEKYLMRRKLNINTRNKALRNLKVYVNIAVVREVIKTSPFVGRRIKKGRYSIEYLTLEEMNLLMELYNSGDISEVIRNALRTWLFAYWQCGLRVSDVKRISFENRVGNDFVISPKKTKRVNDNVIIIPVSPMAMKLAADANPYRKTGLILDLYSEPVINRYLKKAALAAGISKGLNLKMARHSFATHFLQKTKDLATLQLLLGHASITQTMIYAHVTNEEKHAQYDIFMKERMK